MDSTEHKNPVGRPLAYKTVEELDAAIDLYFETDAYIVVGTDDNGEPKKLYAPTMSGLAMSIGMDRRSLTNYAHKDEFFPAIKKARGRVEIALEQKLYGNTVTGIIFNLKNNFGWADKQEVTDGETAQPLSVSFDVRQAVEAVEVTNAKP